MMRLRAGVLLGALLVAATPAISAAQDRAIHVNFGGGPTFAGGDLGDHFKTGWGPAIGVSFAVNDRIETQFEYAYRWFAINDNLDAAGGVLDANHSTHQLDFNLIANIVNSPDSPARVYAIFGPGAYYREVEITKYEGTGIVCDPFWYVCGYYPIESVLGARGGWDFGFNVGLGVGFNVGEDSEFYIESRYHYVIGPDIQSNGIVTPSGDPVSGGGSSTGHYYPLTFGFRF